MTWPECAARQASGARLASADSSSSVANSSALRESIVSRSVKLRVWASAAIFLLQGDGFDVGPWRVRDGCAIVLRDAHEPIGGERPRAPAPTTEMNQEERGVLALARSVFEELAVEQVLERVLEAARELTGARYAALGVLDPSRTRLEQFITSGIDERLRERLGALPTGRGVLGELIRDPRPLRLTDVRAHPSSYGFPYGHPEMGTFLGVPVLVAGAPFGNLYLTDKDGGEFTEEDEDAVVAFAAFAGLAIDHARRYSATEQRRDQLEQSVRALDATLQISRALSGETDLSMILELIARRGQALVSADTLLIELLRGDQVELARGAGDIPSELLGRQLPLRDTVAEAALVTGETQSLAD